MNTTNLEILKKSFDDDGYICIPKFLSSEEVQLLNEKLRQFIKVVVPTMPSKHVFYEDENDLSTLKQMQHLFAYDKYFNKLLENSKFKLLAQVLLDDEVIGKELEYFNKPPRIGKPTPAHQDNYYFKLKPPRAVTMWMALEEVDSENGCLSYIKGSHLKGLRPHGRTQTLGFSQGITDYTENDLANETSIFASPGDLLVHHSLTVHRADGNLSPNRTRQALGLIYFSKSAMVDKEAKDAYQKELSKEN